VVVVGAEGDHEDVGVEAARRGADVAAVGIDSDDGVLDEIDARLDELRVRQSHGFWRRPAEHHVELRVAEDEGVGSVDQRHVHVVRDVLGEDGGEFHATEPRPEDHDALLHPGGTGFSTSTSANLAIRRGADKAARRP